MWEPGQCLKCTVSFPYYVQHHPIDSGVSETISWGAAEELARRKINDSPQCACKKINKQQLHWSPWTKVIIFYWNYFVYFKHLPPPKKKKKSNEQLKEAQLPTPILHILQSLHSMETMGRSHLMCPSVEPCARISPCAKGLRHLSSPMPPNWLWGVRRASRRACGERGWEEGRSIWQAVIACTDGTFVIAQHWIPPQPTNLWACGKTHALLFLKT